MRQYLDADAIIKIEGEQLAFYKKGGPKLKKYPYIIDISTGDVVEKKQVALAKNFLLQHGVKVQDSWTTHHAIRQAIQLHKYMNCKTEEQSNEL